MYTILINKYNMMYLTLMEYSKLEEFNHWWVRTLVDPDLALPFKRDIYDTIKSKMTSRFIISITGLRRVGKTTILYQIIDNLLTNGVDQSDILFFSFDERSADVGDVIETYVTFQKKDLREQRVFVFFDEIQKCEGWENELKKYYDLYPKLKFVISGSESLFIKSRTKETLAGRILDYNIGSFTFREFLRFKNVTKSQLQYRSKVEPLFLKFIQRGGFPESFVFSSDNEFRQYIGGLVVDRIIYKDIPKLFKIDDPDFLATILELVASNPGMYVDYNSLSRQYQKDRRVIKNYFIYLRESYLIRLIGNYRKGQNSSLRKLKKAYPTDTAISSLYRRHWDDSFIGRMVETALINYKEIMAFWKNNHEVDAVLNGKPIEIKFQESIREEDFKGLFEFMKKFDETEGTMITKKDTRRVKSSNGTISLISAWEFFARDNEEEEKQIYFT
jgi:predicted AAA+ superfamily ATPase